MIVTGLKLANLRVIKAAEFRFQPGSNLIVGVNGVGKTSVIDALSVCLSAVVKRANKLREAKLKRSWATTSVSAPMLLRSSAASKWEHENTATSSISRGRQAPRRKKRR